MVQKLITQISEFFSKLSGRDKKLLIAAVVLIVAALFDRLFIAPTMSRLSALDEEIAKQQEIVKRDMHFLSYKNKIMKETKALSPYLMDKIPTDDEIIAAFLKKIEMIATKANVVMAKVTPSVGGEENGYLKYSADIECSGTFAEIIAFMHLLNSSDELIKVSKYSLISKKADSDEVKASMVLSKIVLSKQAVIKPANVSSDKAQSDASNAQTK